MGFFDSCISFPVLFFVTVLHNVCDLNAVWIADSMNGFQFTLDVWYYSDALLGLLIGGFLFVVVTEDSVQKIGALFISY